MTFRKGLSKVFSNVTHTKDSLPKMTEVYCGDFEGIVSLFTNKMRGEGC